MGEKSFVVVSHPSSALVPLLVHLCWLVPAWALRAQVCPGVRPGSSMLPHQVPEPVQSIYLFRESLPTRMPVFPPPFSQAQPVLGGRGGCWDTPRVLYRTTSSVRWRSR